MIFFVVLSAIVSTEIIGYFLHKLLHSEKIPWLSRNHMTHHLSDYGPRGKMRTDNYRSGARRRTNIFGMGMEWLVPSAIIILTMITIMSLFKVAWYNQIIFILSSVSWSVFTFNYMHRNMHEKDFWMLKTPILSEWFKKARKLHDIHHINLSNDGRMNTNYGICFFIMDKVFNTYCGKMQPFNEKGYKAATRRYKNVLIKESK